MKFILFFISLIFFGRLNSQDHIENGSFEIYSRCPNGQGQVDKATGWTKLGGSPDYFNKCHSIEYGKAIVSPEKNSWGEQKPLEGNAFVGMYVDPSKADEAVQTKLNYPLLKDSTYKVTFYASRAEVSFRATSSIGVYLYENMYTNTASNNRKLRNMNTPYFQNEEGNFLTDDKNWIKLSGVFTAKGGERFLAIGNSKPIGEGELSDFINKKELPRRVTKNPHMFSYYYIDSVSLWPVDKDGKRIILQQRLDSVEKGKPVVIENIFFETGKFELLPKSYPELNRLLRQLQEYPDIVIEISGHTDNTGGEESNLQLSENRAKSVVDYLIERGISGERLTYKGYGSSQPLNDNLTEAEKEINRRVEFKIIDK